LSNSCRGLNSRLAQNIGQVIDVLVIFLSNLLFLDKVGVPKVLLSLGLFLFLLFFLFLLLVFLSSSFGISL
jgi:hypothetical protein